MENKEQITEKLVAVNGCGYKVYGLDGGLIGYQCGYSGEGWHYKDQDAIDKKAGVVYIPECEFEDGYGKHTETVPVDAPNYALYKFDDVKKEIAERWEEEYKLTDAQLEYLTKVMLSIAEWACITTYNTDFCYEIEDAIEFDEDGLFTQFQKEAVAEGKFPKEYAEREPYMSELAQWGDEFGNAFKPAEEWEEEEEYDQSLFEYISERRTGDCSSPAEFADEWGKEKYLKA